MVLNETSHYSAPCRNGPSVGLRDDTDKICRTLLRDERTAELKEP